MEKKVDFKLPDMSNVQQGADRGPKMPNGEFELVVERLRPIVTRAMKSAIVGEFSVAEVVSQVPTENRKLGGTLPPLAAGGRVDHYFAFGEQYEFGEKEWAGLMDALGVPAGERNSVQKEFLGEGNAAMGLRVRVRRAAPKIHFVASQLK